MKADAFVNSRYNENNNHHYNENNHHHYNENNNHSYIMLCPWKITSSVCCTVYIIINKNKNKNKIPQNGHTYCTHIQTTLKQSWIYSHIVIENHQTNPAILHSLSYNHTVTVDSYCWLNMFTQLHEYFHGKAMRKKYMSLVESRGWGNADLSW